MTENIQDSKEPVLLTSDELTLEKINYLILKYFEDTDYKHSAFIFEKESELTPVQTLLSSTTHPGLLVRLIQKGLQYKEIEEQLRPIIEYEERSGSQIVNQVRTEIQQEVFEKQKQSQNKTNTTTEKLFSEQIIKQEKKRKRFQPKQEQEQKQQQEKENDRKQEKPEKTMEEIPKQEIVNTTNNQNIPLQSQGQQPNQEILQKEQQYHNNNQNISLESQQKPQSLKTNNQMDIEK
ncbi:f-box-like/wd repeat-containing protein ebi [Anaeramoeba flamelloides]|uniref:F-box-like/wd repeat-containing protein ebi n=1 Tax=Anaeramoeba flamelloides TaxID=1746091 RepID=A0ABQ8XF84_9EUKA|nr:f-box-like/wd repeat-containing protein ebi [Anaeramoeba flamelloides]